MILEYSARHLALVEWANSIKLFAYVAMGIALFVPWGIAEAADWLGMAVALPILIVKLIVAGFGLAVIETVMAKQRIFRAPEFMGSAFLFGVLGMLVHFLLGA